MISSMEYLNISTTIICVIVGIFLVMQIIGEIVEFKGKVVPEAFKIRKYFSRKKMEREIIRQIPETIAEVKSLVNDFEKHYSSDNIARRNKWMDDVNKNIERNDELIKKLDKKLDRSNEDILALLIDSKRNAIIEFAANVADEDAPVTKERFNRVFKLYDEYEDIIERNGLTNGEVDVAYRIIVESYEKHMLNKTFVEDIRGWK